LLAQDSEEFKEQETTIGDTDAYYMNMKEKIRQQILEVQKPKDKSDTSHWKNLLHKFKNLFN
jgi:hypothetical protein